MKAEWATQQALKLDPNLAEAVLAQAELIMYAWTLYLFCRNEEAIIEHELARKFDPFNPMITASLGMLYSYTGRYEDAIREAHNSFRIVKDFPVGHMGLGETYLAMGEVDKALEAHEKLAETAPTWCWFLGYTYALTGHRDKAEVILKQLENTEMSGWNAMGLAVIYGALGRFDEAFKMITYEPHHLWIPWVAVFPMWQPLYDDPRYGEFVRKLSLPKSEQVT